MKDPEVVYVSNLAVSGFLNGVVNLCFTTAKFVPYSSGEGKVEVAINDVVTANLRFDLNVAQQVYAALGKIIDDNTKTPTVN